MLINAIGNRENTGPWSDGQWATELDEGEFINRGIISPFVIQKLTPQQEPRRQCSQATRIVDEA